MKMNTLTLASGLLIIVGTALVLSIPDAQSHPCPRDPSSGHKHCNGDPGGQTPDGIPGCATFGAGPITNDGEGTYCDGNATTDYQNRPASMDIGMNCKSNWFNLAPGGGERRIRLNLSSAPVVTSITSCTGVTTPITFYDTDDAVLNSTLDCANTDPDWAFQQHMRATSSGSGNVCQLAENDSIQATMRFQSHMYHLKTCKGGAKECGTFMEALEVNYDGDSCSDDVTITCTGETDGQCTTWTVASSGPGCLSHDFGAGQSVVLPFSISFQAN